MRAIRRLTLPVAVLILLLAGPVDRAAGEDRDPERTRYLEALSQFGEGGHEAAIATLDPLTTRRTEGGWRRKALFLKARALVELRRFEEACAIYEAEARRLLGESRKEEVAAVILEFANALARKPDPDDVGAPPPNYAKAHNLYRKVLEIEIGRGLEDEVSYRSARTIHQAGNHGQAIAEYRAYLAGFDPDWCGPVGSPERTAGRKRENPPPAGKHVAEARYHLAVAQLAANRHAGARRNLEDLLTLSGEEPEALVADARWQIVKTYRLPSPSGTDAEPGLKAARAFLARHGSDPRAVVAAWWIPETYRHLGRSDQAIEAYDEFAAGKGFRPPSGDAATKKLEGFGKSPAQLLTEWRKRALFQTGVIRFGQKEYERAIDTFKAYVNKYPSGPDWSRAQQGIIDAEFGIGVDAVAEKDYGRARERFREFLEKHPLDGRARQILFTLGQIHYARGGELEEKDHPDAGAAYARAVVEWSRLVGKYPKTEESSVALYRIGLIHEEKLGALSKALDAYRRLTWGSCAGKARARIAAMTKKHLSLGTERTFRTDEPARVTLSVRNIEKLTVKQYSLDLEAFFRKTHGTAKVEDLDIALIQPDRTWEVKIEGYRKYAPLEQEVEVPFPEGRPGVCLVNVSEEDFEATTLILRSDLDVIVKSSRREVLVFAEDMRKKESAEGVELLLSDGKKVFATGATGEDGVFRGRFEELKEIGSVRVLAKRGGHIASNVLGLSGLMLGRGLTAKGYVYTDRPAYLPGQAVSIRGIIREVVDGSYSVPEGGVYEVRVLDSRGRLLWADDRKLSEFGTFGAELSLDPRAPLGAYTVLVSPKKEPKTLYRGSFAVQQFQLQKMHLTLSTPRKVYFRGETVPLSIRAEYYWGEPVAGKEIRYRLPDGRSLVGKTDESGRLVVTFDTTGLTPGRAMVFAASIVGEEVRATHAASLARLGFGLTVAPARDLVLSGEPFDVRIEARLPDGKPAARKGTLFVLRRRVAKPDPVLSGVPWIRRPARPAAEVTVSEHPFITDEKTGIATVRLTLDKGGRYVLRASGEDRFEQVVAAESAVTVSDEEDATKLRFFSDADTLEVGARATIRLHSRIDTGLALVTFDGEEVISHLVTRLQKGMNELPLAVGHEHFPNFRVTVAVMDGRELRTAEKPFTVERRLTVTLRPLADSFEPAAVGKVEVTVVDQLGRPVRTELSLALVDEALFALFPDRTPKILEFFQKDAHREAEFRVVATNGFRYEGLTRRVVKAFLEEQARRTRRAEETRKLKELESELEKRFADADREPAEEMEEGLADSLKRVARARRSSKPQADAPARAGKKMKDGKGDEEEAREELPSAGWWLASVVTGDDGTAMVEIPLPETTTRWRLTARGVTVETLVGEARAELVTRKDFFVEMKAPAALLEGDEFRLLARVHNLTDYEGNAELTLTAHREGETDGKLLERRLTVKLTAHAMTEALFPALEVPAETGLRLEIEAKAGGRADALSRTVPVRPYGLEYADHAGGTARNDAAVTLELPKGKTYLSRWLTVTVGPSLERAIIEMALGTHLRGKRGCVAPGSGHPGGDLLAVVQALAYAKAVDAPETDARRLERRARSLVGTLVVTQGNDGAWRWGGPRARWDDRITAMAFWALCRARQEGLAVGDDVLTKAQRFLAGRFRSVETKDNEAKAMILHALSVNGAAEFAHLNRLHRERNSLSAVALAYTALAFANLDRKDFAGEILDVLLAKSKRVTEDGKVLRCWEGVEKWDLTFQYVDPAESTALGLLVMLAVRPDAPEVRQAVDFLLARRGSHGFRLGRVRGPAIAALAGYFARGKYAATDSRITVLVNGEKVMTVSATGERPLTTIEVPRERVKEGENTVQFRIRGRGEYSFGATLRGFSANLADPKRWHGPYVESRTYYHDNLEYRGRRLRQESSSKVGNVEVGQRVRVRIVFGEPKRYYGHMVIEEQIPAGMVFVRGTLEGKHTHHELRDGWLRIYYPAGQGLQEIQYELTGYATGEYRVLPTVVRDAMSSRIMRLGPKSALTVLPPGEKSDDPYEMNFSERFELGRLLFTDGRYPEALSHLTKLFDSSSRHYERDVARMLLWIHTSEGHYDAKRIVEVFEVLREGHPELEIPFEKILVVGRAYRDIGEHERAYLVFRATIDASFINDANVSAVLEDEGQFLGSVEYQEELWRQYPDTAQVATAYFALSQALYEKAPKAHELAEAERRIAAARGRESEARAPNRIDMLKDAIRLLESFLELYPDDPLADDAAFSLANAYLDLKQYETVVRLCAGFAERFAKSDFESGFRYMIALGHFWQHAYELALEAARIVGEGESRDRDFARYIVGQIHHAKGSPSDAIEWYRKVEKIYSDAREAIRYFQEKRISLPEVAVVRPGEDVEITLGYRNIKEAALQVYRVDLMKLFLREKNLSTITKVHLAGIKPELEQTILLGDGKDYVDKERKTKLALTDEAAYLVICRGDDLFASGLVLITPLKIEVQEDPKSGRLRANVIDAGEGGYASEVHVKAIGSADSEFRSGETDLRGVFVADNLRGKATVIARAGDSRYAFFRGEKWLGAPARQRRPPRPARGQRDIPDYQQNLRSLNEQMQQQNFDAWNKMRRSQSKGVKIQEAR